MEREVNQAEILETLELAAQVEISKIIQPLLETTTWILNHAPWVVEISKNKSQTVLMRVQHMFLKHALTSLRATALLLVRGYTAQAATVASGLFETRLYSNYILDDEGKASQFISHTNSQEFVWRPNQMIRFEAEQNLQRVNKASKPADIKKEIDVIGASYLFLCSLKHGNPIPLRHVVGGRDKIIGKAFNDGGFPVMALPDTRPDDNIVKAVILTAANNSTFYVMRNTGLTVNDESDISDEWFKGLMSQWSNSVTKHKETLDGLGEMPFPTIPK